MLKQVEDEEVYTLSRSQLVGLFIVDSRFGATYCARFGWLIGFDLVGLGWLRFAYCWPTVRQWPYLEVDPVESNPHRVGHVNQR